MRTLKAGLRRIFCLPPRQTLLVLALGYGFVIVVALCNVRNPVLRCASYLASAYALAVNLTGLMYLKPAVRRLRASIAGRPLLQKLRATALGGKLLTDVRFRVRISLWRSLIINSLYIALKLASGIVYRSPWFIALAIYYALLAGIRLMLLRTPEARGEEAEWKRYRLCGCLLLLLNQALSGIVLLIVYQNRGFDYPGLLIYAMALYSFYAVISALVRIARTRRYHSPLLSAARIINLVAALVSLLSLETAMLARFGGNDDPAFRWILTAATGGAVCLFVIGMAASMIRRANRQLKALRPEPTHGPEGRDIEPSEEGR